MNPYRLLLPTVALLVVACAPSDAPAASTPQLAVVGIDSARGRMIADSIHAHSGVRPDSVIAHDGMLRVVLPRAAFGGRITRLRSGCHVETPPAALYDVVGQQAWALRDSTIHHDTVQVVMSAESDTSGSFLSRRICSIGPLVLPIAVHGRSS